MKYMIHSCNKRLWYVKEFLIPSMIKEGIKEDDIIIWNDDNSVGNLKSWLLSCEWVRDNLPIEDGIWHLQDDVLISKDYYEKTQDIRDNETIICGFNNDYNLNNVRKQTGLQPITNMWYSMQTMYVPNKYLVGFINWFYEKVIIKKRFMSKVSQNKFDDWFFKQYMIEEYPYALTYNMPDSIANHIDYLIGGRIVNKGVFKNEINTAYKWRDKDLVEQLAKELELRNEVYDTQLS